MIAFKSILIYFYSIEGITNPFLAFLNRFIWGMTLVTTLKTYYFFNGHTLNITTDYFSWKTIEYLYIVPELCPVS